MISYEEMSVKSLRLTKASKLYLYLPQIRFFFQNEYNRKRIDETRAMSTTNIYFWVRREEANIRNRYNQVSYLTRNTIWECDKTQENTTHKRAKSGDHRAARNRHDSITQITRIHKRSTLFERSAKIRTEQYIQLNTGAT